MSDLCSLYLPHLTAAVALTAKAGTMKRKRQLRDLVEQHNRGYEDDIFDSTPFKKQKKLKVNLVQSFGAEHTRRFTIIFMCVPFSLAVCHAPTLFLPL